ncbi:MAG: hypothetical protein WD342_10625 [Verrucomicrobiales bacterium]
MERVKQAVGGDEPLFRAFENFVARAPDADLDRLFEEVDASDYSLRDWVEALVEFDRWIGEGGTPERPFAEMVGYVHCCTLINAPLVSLPKLKVIVNQSLTEFGFERF